MIDLKIAVSTSFLAWIDFVATWLPLVIAAALIYLVGLPLLMKKMMLFNLDHPIDPIGPDDLTETQVATLLQYQGQLEALGFTEVGWLCIKEMVPGAQIYFVLMNHPTLRVASMATMTVGVSGDSDKAAQAKSPTIPVKWNIEFSSDALDDSGYTTANINEAPTPGMEITSHSVRLPGEQDLARILKIHNARLNAKGFSEHQLKPLPVDLDDWISELRKMERRQFDAAVQHGFLTPSADGRLLHITTKGAFLMTWSQLWPFKNIRMARYSKKWRQEIQQLPGGPY
jgi:hypothetical protein